VTNGVKNEGVKSRAVALLNSCRLILFDIDIEHCPDL
jgi:hypothetical protein